MVDGARDAAQLPIHEHRDRIIRTVATYQVTFIQGETGCGKSSMVPQFLVGQTPDTNIIVTQPRRFAAISLANRVGRQLGDEDLVGYRLGRGERRETPSTRVTFCTTGYLLQFLAYYPKELSRWTHVVLDEVHERTMDSDLLLLLMKLLLKNHPTLKLVIMSATLQPAVFIDYFRGYNVTQAPLLVGAKRFPVETIFLDQLERIPGVTPSELPCYQQAVASEAFRTETANFTKPMQHLLVGLLRRIAKPNTCYLVFLPGVSEIENAAMELNRTPPPCPSMILPLHSLLPTEEQDKVMKPIQPGHCKIVLSTNIAESSVTIPDAHFVIDGGMRRGIFTDETTGRPALLCRWISRASAKQRAGRTGRVGPGTVVHLFPELFHQNALREFDEPEMQHATLDKTILTVRLLLPAHGLPSDVLKKAITPPTPSRVAMAIEDLYAAAALEAPEERAQVTAIGRLAVALPLQLASVRLILIGATLGLLPEAVAMAACHEQPDIFVQPSRLFMPDIGRFTDAVASVMKDRIRLDGGLLSEPLTNLAAYRDWLEGRRGNLSVRRIKMVDLVVGEICRVLLDTDRPRREDRPPIPPAGAARLQELYNLVREGGKGRGGTRRSTGRVFSTTDRTLLSFMLAAASPNFLRAKHAEWDVVEEVVAQKKWDPRRTVLLSGVPTTITQPAQLLRLFNHPDCRAVQAMSMPGVGPMDWLMELAPTPLDPLRPGAIQDLAAGPKVLHQFYLANRNRLALPSGDGFDGSEMEVQGMLFANELQWHLARSNLNDEEQLMVVRINARSHLRTMADLDCTKPGWMPLTAAALSLTDIPGTLEIAAGGVTVLPVGVFGPLVQLVMARRVRRMQVEPLETNEDGVPVAKDRLIVAAHVPGRGQEFVQIIFRPPLLESDLDLINDVRRHLSGVVRAEIADDYSLPAAVHALLRRVHSRTVVIDEEEVSTWPWFSVPRQENSGYLPALGIKKQTSLLTEAEITRMVRRLKSVQTRDADYASIRNIIINFFRANPFRDPEVMPHPLTRKTVVDRIQLLGFKRAVDMLDFLPDICTVDHMPARPLILIVPRVPQEEITTAEDRILMQVRPQTWNNLQRQYYAAFRRVVAEALTTVPSGTPAADFALKAGLLEVGETRLRYRLSFGSIFSLLFTMPDIIFLKGPGLSPNLAKSEHIDLTKITVHPAEEFPEFVVERAERFAIFRQLAASVAKPTTPAETVRANPPPSPIPKLVRRSSPSPATALHCQCSCHHRHPLTTFPAPPASALSRDSGCVVS